MTIREIVEAWWAMARQGWEAEHASDSTILGPDQTDIDALVADLGAQLQRGAAPGDKALAHEIVKYVLTYLGEHRQEAMDALVPEVTKALAARATSSGEPALCACYYVLQGVAGSRCDVHGVACPAPSAGEAAPVEPPQVAPPDRAPAGAGDPRGALVRLREALGAAAIMSERTAVGSKVRIPESLWNELVRAVVAVTTAPRHPAGEAPGASLARPDHYERTVVQPAARLIAEMDRRLMGPAAVDRASGVDLVGVEERVRGLAGALERIEGYLRYSPPRICKATAEGREDDCTHVPTCEVREEHHDGALQEIRALRAALRPRPAERDAGREPEAGEERT